MNIHLNGIKDAFDINSISKDDILAEVTFGSTLYGLNDKDSDKDVLRIVKNIKRIPNLTHHQLQMTEDGVDYIYCTLDQFINNTLSGDSTINFEIIMSGQLEGTKLDFIHQDKGMFVNYNIILSYLGMARRDIKYKDKAKTDRDRIKKLTHILRGIEYARTIMSGIFDFDDLDSVVNLSKELSWEEEGFIGVDKDFNRVKIKGPAYVAMHYTSTAISPYAVLDVIRANELDEYLVYFESRQNDLRAIETKYYELIGELEHALYTARNNTKGFNQKEFAIYVNENFTGYTRAYIFTQQNNKFENAKEYVDEKINNKKLYKLIVE